MVRLESQVLGYVTQMRDIDGFFVLVQVTIVPIKNRVHNSCVQLCACWRGPCAASGFQQNPLDPSSFLLPLHTSEQKYRPAAYYWNATRRTLPHTDSSILQYTIDITLYLHIAGFCKVGVSGLTPFVDKEEHLLVLQLPFFALFSSLYIHTLVGLPFQYLVRTSR